ncbi:hypothetical protein AB0G04_06410 [Actinoplanes sp. NPDC023801]
MSSSVSRRLLQAAGLAVASAAGAAGGPAAGRGDTGAGDNWRPVPAG